MTFPRARRVAVVGTLTLLAASCGGSEPAPEVAPAPTSAPTAAPTAAPSAEPEAAKEDNRVDLLEGKVSQQPKKLPMVRIDSPGSDQFVPAHYAQNYKIRFKATNWSQLPEGSYLQFILDNVPYKPVTDPKAKLKLADMTVAGAALAEGEHIIAAYVARKNGEAIRGAKAVSVRRFWVGKRTGDSWKAGDPLLVLGSPSGTYEGAAADQIMADFYVINAGLGDKDHSLRMTLHGPGIKAEGMQRYLTEWKPLLVWGPAAGDYTIKAELLGPKGQVVEGGWNSTERKFTVKR